MSVYFNLSLDDVHPESDSVGDDCGGDMESGVLSHIIELWKNYPELKVTLFVTPNWKDKANDMFFLRNAKRLFGKDYTNMWDGDPFILTSHEGWCRWINSFENFEVALHGYDHHRAGRLHSQEFEGMGLADARKRIIMAERIFRESGLKYVRGFRPPGWGISDGLFEALKGLDFDFVSLDPSACGIGDVSRFRVGKFRELVNVPQNWDIGKDPIDKGVHIAEKYGLLMAKGHIEDNYGGERIGNGLNARNVGRIKELLSRIEDKDVIFSSMRDISRMADA